MSDDTKKIPSTCRVCGEALSRGDMECFLSQCERNGKDPIALAFVHRPPGIACVGCLSRAIAEGAEDGNPAAQLALRELRFNALGVEELPDGKPVTWH